MCCARRTSLGEAPHPIGGSFPGTLHHGPWRGTTCSRRYLRNEARPAKYHAILSSPVHFRNRIGIRPHPLHNGIGPRSRFSRHPKLPGHRPPALAFNKNAVTIPENTRSPAIFPASPTETASALHRAAKCRAVQRLPKAISITKVHWLDVI